MASHHQIEPDYTSYPLKELWRIRDTMSQSDFPERYSRLLVEIERRQSSPEFEAIQQEQKEIEEGQRRYQELFSGKTLYYRDAKFKWTILLTLFLMILTEVTGLLVGDSSFLFPLLFGVALLVSILLGRHEQIFLLRIWSISLVIQGLSVLITGCRMLNMGSDDSWTILAIGIVAIYFGGRILLVLPSKLAVKSSETAA